MYQYSKDQCLHMDWSNTKEINAEALAWCIVEYDLDISRVPSSRVPSVEKEIAKLVKQRAAEEEQHLIGAILAAYEVETGATEFELIEGQQVGYYLDPDLFQTAAEASEAISILNSNHNDGMHKTEILSVTHKNTNTHSRDLTALKSQMQKFKQQYGVLGGDIRDFDELLKHLPLPTKNTLKQEIDAQRDYIAKHFISFGTSTTRANKIAIAITSEIYTSLK